MPKILRDLNVSSAGRRDSTTPWVGVLASEIPTGGDLPDWLLNDIDAAYPNRLYSLTILTMPSSGTLFLDKTGAGFFSGAPDGTYTGTQRIDKYDPGVGLVGTSTSTYSLQVGTLATDTTPPVITSAVVQPLTPGVLVLLSSETLNTSYAPPASAFSITGHAVSGVTVLGDNISLNVTPDFVGDEPARTIAYTQPASSGIRDVAGNLLGSFAARSITNNAPVTPPVDPAPDAVQFAAVTKMKIRPMQALRMQGFY